jgi:hypothetical protein
MPSKITKRTRKQIRGISKNGKKKIIKKIIKKFSDKSGGKKSSGKIQKKIILTKKRLFKKYIGGAGVKKSFADVYNKNNKIYIYADVPDGRKSLYKDDLYNKTGVKDTIEIGNILYEISEIKSNKLIEFDKQFVTEYNKDGNKKKYTIIETKKGKKNKKFFKIFETEMEKEKIDDKFLNIPSTSPTKTDEQTLLAEILKQDNDAKLKQWERDNKDAIAALNDVDKQQRVKDAVQARRDGFAGPPPPPNDVERLVDEINLINDIVEIQLWELDDDNTNAMAALNNDADRLTVTNALQARIDVLSTAESQRLVDEINLINDEQGLVAWEEEDDNTNAMAALNDADRLTVTNALQARRDGFAGPPPPPNDVERLVDEINLINDIVEIQLWELDDDNTNAMAALNNDADRLTVTNALQARIDVLSTAESQRLVDEINLINDEQGLVAWEEEDDNTNAMAALNDADRLTVTNALQARRDGFAGPQDNRDVAAVVTEITTMESWDDLTDWEELPLNINFRAGLNDADGLAVTDAIQARRNCRNTEDPMTFEALAGRPHVRLDTGNCTSMEAIIGLIKNHMVGMPPEVHFRDALSNVGLTGNDIDNIMDMFKQNRDYYDNLPARDNDNVGRVRNIRSRVISLDQHDVEVSNILHPLPFPGVADRLLTFPEILEYLNYFGTRRTTNEALYDGWSRGDRGRAQNIGGKKKKKNKKKNTKKKTRKHRGIIQIGGNKGRLRKGYKYSGKKLKSGLSQIVKCVIKI